MKEKRSLCKIWKNGGSKEHYVLAKKVAKRRVFVAKKKAEKKMKDIETDTNNNYRTVKQMKQENKDIVGKKYIWYGNGVPAFNEDKKKA